MPRLAERAVGGICYREASAAAALCAGTCIFIRLSAEAAALDVNQAGLLGTVMWKWPLLCRVAI